MKAQIKILAVFFLGVMFIAGCSNYGMEKSFNGVQLFYTSSVTESEADSLGQYLIDAEFADGETKTVQLNKTGNTYEFRMVVKKGIENDEEFVASGKQFASDLSASVFNGSQVDVHFCDENLETLRVLPMSIE